MKPRDRATTQLLILVGVLALLVLLFPPVFRFVEMAAMELRYFWWLILLVALAFWLIWGLGRRPKE